MPGAEFQLSAPYAVCLVAGVGFWRYLGIGVCASLVQLMMGTHTPWNVLVAMVFRVAAGLIVSLLPGKKWLWCWPVRSGRAVPGGAGRRTGSAGAASAGCSSTWDGVYPECA